MGSRPAPLQPGVHLSVNKLLVAEDTEILIWLLIFSSSFFSFLFFVFFFFRYLGSARLDLFVFCLVLLIWVCSLHGLWSWDWEELCVYLFMVIFSSASELFFFFSYLPLTYSVVWYIYLFSKLADLYDIIVMFISYMIDMIYLMW